MTRFQVGDLVVSRINEQGLTKGYEYVVVDVITSDLAFGTFVTYVVEDDEERWFAVGNGHLVLDRTEVTA